MKRKTRSNMAKRWVVLQKFAGLEVEADTDAEAEEIAYNTPESEYEYGFEGDEWVVTNVKLIEEE